MEPSDKASSHDWFLAVIAGLEAGILGSLGMLAWFLLVADWRHESPWAILNLFGNAFYPGAALDSRLISATFAGFALHVFLTGAVGLVYGIAVATIESRLRRILFGFVAALAWYYLSFSVVWRRADPAVLHYSNRASFLVAHVLLGLFLALQPSLLDRLRHPQPATRLE